MSKMYNRYLELKKKDDSKVYLFKNGIFFLALEDDAKKLNELLNLKLTVFSKDVEKCGFPVSVLKKYIDKLDKYDIEYELIDNMYNNINSPKEYLESIFVRNVVTQIKEIDFNDTSPKQAFNILYDLYQAIIAEDIAL